MSQVREAWLLAGGLLPVAVEPLPDSARVPVEPVRPRSYRHPALGRRVVIRVVGDSAAVADDRALAFLGFEPPAVGEPLALGPRRQVGFPQWVLVNDPELAGGALAVAEEMEPAAALARTKPGHAKDLYERLARRLPAAHQPSFWEQAGRVFLAAGRRRHAATAFERARAAERIHALPVDEAARREVFLEFALAGALPAKSLAGYQAELRQGRSPAEAYQGFRELVLRRAFGGLPPWTELPGCARRFAHAAGLDPDTEEERLLGELLVLPATRRAPAGFWRHSRPALLRMAAASAALRGRLLNLFPAPSREGGWNPPPSFEVWWLGLLDAAGALDGVTQPAATLPLEALPAQGAASWLGHYLAAARQGWWAPPRPLVAALLRLIPRMADRLKAEGRPLILAPRSGPYPGRLDANLLDLCLEQGVPVADPPPAAVIDLAAWLRSGAGGGVRRDLEFVAADRRFGPLLDAAVPAFCANARRPAEELLVSPALRPLVQGWLERTVKGQPHHHGEAATAGRARRRLDRAAAGHDSLVALAGSLEALAPAVGPHTFSRFPDAQAALGSIDVAVPLAATLRGGLLDELGWPALDEAVEELGAGGQRHWSASWPVLVVWNPSRVIAVGPGGRVAEHDLRLTYPHGGIPRVLYADGQFLVVPPNPDGPAYWSGAPTETFTIEHARPWGWFSHAASGFAALLSPDGGLVSAGGVLYPGDRTLPQDDQHLVSDGATCWTVEWAQGVPHALRELDPSTGEPGRFSLPSFFEDRAAPGETLLLLCCSLAPLPDGLAGTPLGRHGGLVGFRVAAAGPGQATRIEGVDGRSLTVPLHISDPVGLVTWPGAQEPRVLSGRPWGPLALWDPGMNGPLVEFSAGFTYGQNGLAAGTGFTLPPAFWHHLTPRDEAGSLALRGVTDEAARELLHAALADLADHRQHQAERPPRTAAAVERLLPAVSHPRLVRGVLGAVQAAALLSRRHDELVGRGAPIPSPSAPTAALAAPAAAPPAEPPLDVDALLSGLVGIHHGAYRDRYSPWHEQAPRTTLPVARQLHLLGRFFAEAAGPDAVAHVRWETALPWRCLLSSIGALALRAVSPAVHAHEREALLALLELWAESPFAAGPSSFWIGRVEGPPETAGRSERGAYVVMLDQRFMTGSGREVWTGMCIERRSGDGTATALPAGVNVVSAQRLEAGWGTPARLAEFVRLARERGPVRWDPAVPEALAARTGLTRAEATLLWATFPEMSEWGQESDFLGPGLRKTLGLTRSEAKAARRALPQDIEHRCRVLHAAMPDDPATLWAPLGNGPDDAAGPVARLAAAWTRLFGRRSPYPQDALVEAAGLGRPTPPGMLLAPLLDRAASRPLTRDRDCWITRDQHDRLVLATNEGDADELSGMVADLAATIPWAFACRPVGDPLRGRLPELLTLVRDRLSHPGLLLAVSPWHSPYNPGEELRRLFGQTPYRTRNGTVLDGSADDGLTVAVARHHSLALFFRPALLGDDARSAVLRAHGDPGWGPTPATVTAVELLRSAGYAAMAERVGTTPVPDGGFEANPAHAAPALVQEVQATLTLSGDAAVLYLQLLALAEPTDRNLRRWDGWTLQRHRRAAADLLSAGLVLQAKREGARRSLFLPGEWLPLRKANRAMPEEWKASRLPLEAWKAPLYRLERDRHSGQPRGPLPRFLPLVPLHELFAMAWARVQAGDRPGGEQA